MVCVDPFLCIQIYENFKIPVHGSHKLSIFHLSCFKCVDQSISHKLYCMFGSRKYFLMPKTNVKSVLRLMFPIKISIICSYSKLDES